MANCHICKVPVTVGFAVCEACAGGDTAQTNFKLMTSSPKELAAWLEKIWSNQGRFCFDEQFCLGDCDNPEDCCHELECIEKWLTQPADANKC